MALLHFIKNKFVSTIIGSIGIYLSIAFLLPFTNFAVYITSYIHLNQEFVTMHYGIFIGVIFGFAGSFSRPLGGYFESIIGLQKTILLGVGIIAISNAAFIFQQNIWLCYFLVIILGFGSGFALSCIQKNLTLFRPNKKGMISGFMGLGLLILTLIFTITGEKVISFEGYTLKPGEELFPDYIAERIYLYYTIGEICIPIGLLIAFLFFY